MTYTVGSSFRSDPVGTQLTWQTALQMHGVSFNPYDGCDAISKTYFDLAPHYGMNPDLALAQAVHETGWFSSARWREERNPAGLGVTSNDTPPNPFPSPQEGIRAHLEHLACYVYDAATCPCDHAHLADRRHFFHDGKPAVQDLVRLPARAWANPGVGYAASIVSIANSVGGSQPMPRIIVHAGHENIGSITADKIGQASADALRGGTGANGERTWTPLVADELVRLLKAAGADAVRTDAIYHADVYGPDADLVVALHYDGVGGTGRAQYCMAATVHSGPSTEAADSRADVIVQEWYASYPAAMHIAGNGPITDGMTQYYGGWYRTANTPMLLIEHCIGADGGGIRGDRPTPQAAAAADFAVLAKHFGLSGHAPPSDAEWFPQTGHSLGGGFRTYWDTEGGVPIFGYPITNELTEDGVTVQYFERAVFELVGGNVELRRLGAAAAKAKGYSGPGID